MGIFGRNFLGMKRLERWLGLVEIISRPRESVEIWDLCIPMCHIQAFSGIIPGQQCHHIPGQPVPGQENPFNEGIFF